MPKYIHNNAIPYLEILVSTVETVKMGWILKEMFLVGLSGITTSRDGRSNTLRLVDESPLAFRH